MGNHLVNFVEVLGEQEDVKKFYDDVCGEGKTIFDFKKIIPMLHELKRFSNKDLVEYYNNQYENWGKKYCYGDIEEFNSHPNILSYKFYDTGIVPLDLFNFLIEKYSSLIFEIFIWEPAIDSGFIINGFYGHYTKYTYESLELRKLNNDEDLFFTFRHDYIRNKDNILEAIVFNGTGRPCCPIKNKSKKKYNFISEHFSIFTDTDEDIVSLRKVINYMKKNDCKEFKPEIKFNPEPINFDDDSKESVEDIINECLFDYIKNDIDKGSNLYAKTKCLINN